MAQTPLNAFNPNNPMQMMQMPTQGGLMGFLRDPRTRNVMSALSRTNTGARLNQIAQAIFHEMFGDPKTNPKGLAIVSLGEIADFYSGNSLPKGEAYSGQKDGYLLLKVSDLNHIENQEVVSCAANWSSKPGTRAGTCPASAPSAP